MRNHRHSRAPLHGYQAGHERRRSSGGVCPNIIAYHLDIDGSGQAEIQNLAYHVSGQESETDPWKLLRKCQTKLVNVVVRGMVFGGQGHENVDVRGANRSRIAVRQIDAAIRQAYVVNDALDFACWNLPSNRLLDLVTEVGGL